MVNTFRRIAQKVSHWVGTPLAFMMAVSIIIAWALLGPVFHYTDTWQLIINTGTTIVTFLMVFMIQNTQNRDAQAIQLKLDELIRATAHARNKLINLEDLSDQELANLHNEFCKIQEEYNHHIEKIVQARKKKKHK